MTESGEINSNTLPKHKNQNHETLSSVHNKVMKHAATTLLLLLLTQLPCLLGTSTTNRLYRAIGVGNISRRARRQYRHIIKQEIIK